MINFGSVDGVREKVSKFIDMLSLLGDSGTFTLETSPKTVDLKITDSVSVEIQVPLTIEYKFEGQKLFLTFEKPYPIGSFRKLSKFVDAVTLTLDKIEISLQWSPDGFVVINS